MVQLEKLNLAYCRFVTDDVRYLQRPFTALKKLYALKELDLSNTYIHDEQLKDVDLPIEKLSLVRCTNLTDGCLPHLIQFKKLAKIDLTNTQITDKGISELQKAKPELKIVRR